MTAFSPLNLAINTGRIEKSDLKPPAPIVKKSLLSVLKGLDEVPPETAHPEPILQTELSGRDTN